MWKISTFLRTAVRDIPSTKGFVPWMEGVKVKMTYCDLGLAT